MDELQIMKLENTDVGVWNFAQLRAELQDYLSPYAALVYTDDTIKDAKKDRTGLNKMKTAIEDARKAYKAQCMEPYNAVEPQIKELVGLIEDHRLRIDGMVKEYEERKREEKEQEVRSYYDRKAAGLGDLASALYPMLFDKKWVAASTGRAKYQEEILEKIALAAQEIETIRQMNSPFVDTLLEVYAATLSLEEVERKQRELTVSVEKAGLTAPAPQPAPDVPPQPQPETGTQGGVVMRLFASPKQLDQLTDFMDAIGVRYERL